MLSDFLKTGKDWGRMKTSIPGVFVIKMPAYRSSPTRLAVEINPLDASGNPTKRRGLYIRFNDELESFRDILNEEKLSNLMELLDLVNPSAEGESRRISDKIIEL